MKILKVAVVSSLVVLGTTAIAITAGMASMYRSMQTIDFDVF